MDSKQYRGRTAACMLSIILALGILFVPGARAGSFAPPVVTPSSTTTPYTGYSGIKSAAVDAAGNIVYLVGGGSGQLMELPANGGAPITLLSGLNYPKSMAIDNAGNAYAGDYTGHLWKVAIGGGTPVDILSACGTLDGYYLGEHLVATDGLGNVYTGGNNSTALFKITAGGSCSIVSGVTLDDADGDASTGWEDGYSRVAADNAGNLYYAVQNNLYTIPVGASTPTLVTSNFANNWIVGLSTDTLGNVYVTNVTLGAYAGLTYEVPFLNGVIDGAAMFVVLPFASSYDVGVDAAGTLYTTDGNGISLNTVGKLRFPATSVGSQSAAATVNLYFNSAQTLSSMQLLAGAGSSAEFTNTGAGSCATGTDYAAGSSCTVTLAFTPSGIGLRAGNLQVSNGSTVIAEAAIYGQGSGAGLVVDPATQTAVGSGWNDPYGVAIDAHGNILATDKAAGAVTFYPQGATTGTILAASLSSPTGIAIGSDGNVYVAESGAGKIVMIPYLAGAYGSAATVVSGLSTPTAIAVAGNGDLYLADSAAGMVYRMANNGGAINFTNLQTVGSGFKSPAGIFIDANSSLYIADSQAGTIVKIAGATQSILATGLTTPLAVAVDAGGSLYVAQQNVSTIERIPYSAGSYNLNAATQLGIGLQSPVALTADTAGNLYLADSGLASVLALSRTASTLNFGKVNVGDTSATEALTLSSMGDLPLTFGATLDTASGNTGDFNTTAGCTAGGTLIAGTSCSVSSAFSPAIAGTRSELLAFASNAANAVSIQSTLTGVGTQLPKTTTTLKQITTGTLSFGEPIQISATVATTSTGTPSGTIQFLVNGVSYGSPVPLSSGTADVTIKGLAAGAATIGAIYSGDVDFAGSSAPGLSLQIALAATNTTLTSNISSSTPVAPGTSVTLTASVATSITTALPSGSITFATGNTVLGVAALGASGTAVLTSTSLPQGVYAVTATYGGDTGFATSVSNSVNLAIEPPQFVVSSTPTALSISSSGVATTSFVIAPISGYTGGVDLQCSGLPANTTCTFTPATLTFAYSTNSAGATVAPSPQTVTLTLQTATAPASTVAAWLLPLGAIPLFLLARKRRALRGAGIFALLALAIVAAGGTGLMTGCNASKMATPTGTKTVTVTMTGSPSGTSTVPTSGTGNIVKSFTFTLNVQ